MMNAKQIVSQARAIWDAELHTDRSKQILRNAVHLEALIGLADVRPGQHYLDLGTGTGYVAFEMARRYPEIHVTGLDVAAAALETNRSLQQDRGIENVEFVPYDGVHLPFDDAAFWGVVCRYAFHHLPNPAFAAAELLRVVQPNGFVLISDPITFDEDTAGYIDAFQRLRPDGHVHFLRRAEMEQLFQQHGFRKQAEFTSIVSYPREMNDEYERLLAATPSSLLERYHVEVRGHEVYSTLEIANVLFRKGN